MSGTKTDVVKHAMEADWQKVGRRREWGMMGMKIYVVKRGMEADRGT